MSDSVTPATREYVLYLRKSKGRAGIARQRRECHAYCERIGGRIVAEFVDTDRTAFVKVGSGPSRRDQYQAMLDTLHADERSFPLGVMAWHADRLHRDPSEAETFMAVCVAGNHFVETARSGSYDLTTPTGRKRFRNDVVDAAYEVDHSIERIESMKNEAAKEGRWLGGRRPFGYEADGVTVRPVEALELKWASEAILSGMSLHAVVRDWNARGIKTSTGAVWRTRSVRNVLIRMRNAGIMEHREEEVGPAQWPAIVEETTWRALCALLRDPERRTSPGPERRWLLSGIAECGLCEAEGAPSYLRAGSAGAGGRDGRSTVAAYRCGRDEAIKHVVRNAIHLDKYVSALAVEWLAQPGAVDAFTVHSDGGAARERTIEREALRIQEQEAGEMFAAREMTRSQLAATNREIAARRAALDQADASAARVTALAPFRNGDPAEVWEGLDLDRRRTVISEIMRVIVLPAGKGRPEGWTPEYGKEWGYFDPNAINIIWRVQ
ncbi:recombinase family protein [Streptosporangium canum]|uniref:recombinase family protein n=1 Tax=Streptosporangium canum TaxID=324952 RepID=UPI00344AB9BE